MAKLLQKNSSRSYLVPLLHELSDVKQLFEVVAKEKQVIPAIVEKDYWLMHCLWGLQQQGFDFSL